MYVCNYLRIKWNDTAILHDLSSSFLPRKTNTSGYESAIHAHISLWNGIWTLAGEILFFFL